MILSKFLVHCLGVKQISRRSPITVSKNANARHTGLIQGIPVTFAYIKTDIKCLALERVPVNLLMGLTQLEQFRDSVDVGDQFVDMEVSEMAVLVDLKLEFKRMMSQNESKKTKLLHLNQLSEKRLDSSNWTGRRERSRSWLLTNLHLVMKFFPLKSPNLLISCLTKM